ncbi:MAG: hypothetical protein JW704_12675 [Anaerolineaceae bacterium]|nr:hypothetical protein [Anaerolineaceae bacterium]
MESFQESMTEYRKQLGKGEIQKAYRGLMDYLQSLRAHFQKAHPEFSAPSALYFGYMDMSYFALVPASLKPRSLKIAVVFLHKEHRFEVWLAAANKGVQAEYLKKIKASGWNKYRLVPSAQGYDSIVEHVPVAEPDFGDLEGLTGQIEDGTLNFIKDVEDFLASH